MPEPDYGSDYLLYKYISNPLAKHLCFISPSIITTVGVLFIVPLYFNIINKGNIYIAVGLMTLIYFFDTLDGSIARQCDECSTVGKYYDLLADAVKSLILTLGIYYCYTDDKKNKKLFYLLIFFVFLTFCQFILIISTLIVNDNDHDNIFDTEVEKIFHNNLLLINIIMIIVIKKIIK